ncbi:hypothetical protein ACN47E_000016 [Coniothyrium glycines]
MSGHGFRNHPQLDALVSWFVAKGGWMNPDVQISYSDLNGFHMRAVRSFSLTPLVSCPLSLTISHLNLDPSRTEVITIDSPLRLCQGHIPRHILTYLLLIEQRASGAASPWHAYIACLPDSEYMTTPIWFDEDDMAFLVGTGLAPAARDRREELYKQWQNAITVLKEFGIALHHDLDFKSLLWAATIFSSRAFISTHILPGEETTPMLFPVVDILNHSVSAKVEWNFEPYTSFTLKCLEPESVEPGQELFNNYAPKQNDELLLGYGFCLDHNPVEQFALKLAFPPMLREFATAAGLLESDNVPFGMSSNFLKTDPNNEQHFLRTKDHPFGRYENNVSIFRGVPPYVVHFFFIQTMMMLERDVQSIDTDRPGVRITLQVLVLLHQALEQRCQSLPLHNTQVPKNVKQKFAKIYRDGQAKIIHAVREELKAAIADIRTVKDGELMKTTLLSISDASILMASDFSHDAKTFQAGLAKHSLQEYGDEDIIWALLLMTFTSLMLTDKASNNSPIFTWICSLVTKHPLPMLEDGIEDAETYTFLDDNFGDFFYPADGDADLLPAEYLDDLGLAFDRQTDDSTMPAFISGPTENLGVRIIMWAMKVVDQEVLPVFEDGSIKKCLFVQPEGKDGVFSNDSWMFEDADISS